MATRTVLGLLILVCISLLLKPNFGQGVCNEVRTRIFCIFTSSGPFCFPSLEMVAATGTLNPPEQTLSSGCIASVDDMTGDLVVETANGTAVNFCFGTIVTCAQVPVPAPAPLAVDFSLESVGSPEGSASR